MGFTTSNRLIVYTVPGGGFVSALNEKKVPKVHDRPWQKPIRTKLETCPFHNPDERATAYLTTTDRSGDTWFVIDSKYAPNRPFHRLIVPEDCWEPKTMEILGGPEKIRIACELATCQFALETERKLWKFSTQVGLLAAQTSVPHCCWHLYSPFHCKVGETGILFTEPLPTDLVEMTEHCLPELQVTEDANFRAVAGGSKTGQCFVIPKKILKFRDGNVGLLGRFIHQLVSLYVEAFRTPEGMGPNFQVEFEIYEGYLRYGFLVPILHPQGSLESAAELNPCQPKNMLWSHHATAAYLQERS